MVVCDFCGRAAQSVGASSADTANAAVSTPTEEIPLTWVTSVENGRRRVYCEQCARDHLRSIESKLDSEWW